MSYPVLAALYVRDITGLPAPAEQMAQLEAIAAARGWNIAERADDPPRPSGPTRDRRPAFDRLVRDLGAGKLHVLAVTGITAAARSMPDLLRTLAVLRSARGRLYVAREGIDTGEPGGELAAVEALNTSLSEHKSRAVSEAMGRAKAAGKRIGAARVAPEVEEQVRQLRREGIGIGRTAKLAGVGVSTVQRIDAELRHVPGCRAHPAD